jgi:hypothetical protein
MHIQTKLRRKKKIPPSAYILPNTVGYLSRNVILFYSDTMFHFFTRTTLLYRHRTTGPVKLTCSFLYFHTLSFVLSRFVGVREEIPVPWVG